MSSEASDHRFARMAVIGVGLIGGSFALATRKSGRVERVVGVARTEATRAAALQAGIVDEVTDDPTTAVRGADLVYVATPLGAMESVMSAIAPVVRPDAVVTDAGSTKASTLVLARQHLAGRCAFIGGHPMAGSENAGPRAARADLFMGRTYFLTPTEDTAPEALGRLRALLTGIGAAVVLCDPQEHDRLVAFTSHLPHLLASALCATVAEASAGMEALGPFVGSGLRDSTRIAKSPAEVWRDILCDNRENVLMALEHCQQQMDRYRRAIESEDLTAVEALWQEAADFRRGLDEI